MGSAACMYSGSYGITSHDTMEGIERRKKKAKKKNRSHVLAASWWSFPLILEGGGFGPTTRSMVPIASLIIYGWSRLVHYRGRHHFCSPLPQGMSQGHILHHLGLTLVLRDTTCCAAMSCLRMLWIILWLSVILLGGTPLWKFAWQFSIQMRFICSSFVVHWRKTCPTIVLNKTNKGKQPNKLKTQTKNHAKCPRIQFEWGIQNQIC